VEARGPFNPNQKQAFIIVTRGAHVKLFYQGATDWNDVKAEIDGISGSGDLITHASFCSSKGKTSTLYSLRY
jgi:hypothetical protein